MSILKTEVAKRLVAFDCIELINGKSRGCGTAFWVDLGDGPKLLTAKHLPWNRLADPPVKEQSGETLLVIWTMITGESGYGLAKFHVHPNKAILDYAVIEFCDVYNAPPAILFGVSSNLPTVQSSVVASGFPGPFRIGALPVPAFAVGIIDNFANGNDEILVSGTAGHGYSGGPSFIYVDYDYVADSVIGLMSGQPEAKTLANAGIANGFVLVSSIAFK